MSAIYKLSIQGIRSFDANDRETIEFGKPLTLIVGTNGSGKTTIIECLKYATTGDLPPNSKNGAFIHDPKITGEKDIRAQVKLAFTNAKGVNMIVTRNIQLLAKKTANTFKTLEGQLVAINKGERTTLSTRATELDQQIPLYLGVPKAILDYVIFCHQEDSLWPLSEPSILKKRFDEIFQAMKFTKALDNLKSIKKDMGIDIKLLKQSVEHLKTDRDRSKVTKFNISKLESKIKEYQTEVNQIESKLKIITEQSDSLFHTNQHFQEVLSRLDNLKHTKMSLKEQIERLQLSVELLPHSNSELESMLENFNKALNDKRDKLLVLKAEKQEAADKLRLRREKQQNIVRTQGELISKRQQYEESKIKMETILENLSTFYQIPKDRVTSEVAEMLKIAERKLREQMDKHQDEESALDDGLSTLKSSLIKKEQQLSYISADVNKLDEQVTKLNELLSKINITNGELETEKKILQNYETKLKNWNYEITMESLSNLIRTKDQEIILLEDEAEKIQQRITKANQHSDLYARLTILKNSKTSRRNELKSLSKEILAMAEVKLPELNDSKNLVNQFRTILVKVKNHVSSLKQEKDMSMKTTIGLENEVKHVNSQIYNIESQKDRILLDLKERLPEDVDLDSYDNELKDAEESYKIALENLKMHKTTLEFNLKALEIANNENCCYLCQRKFDSSIASNKLITDLKARTDKNFQIALENTAKEVDIYLNELKGCYDEVLSFKKYKQETLCLQQRLRETESKFKEQKISHSLKEQALKDSEATISFIEENLQPKISKYINILEEKQSLDAEFDRAQEELSIYGSDKSFESMEKLQLKLKENSETLRNLRKEISEMQAKKEEKSQEYNNILNLIREKNSTINELETSLHEYNTLNKELKENEVIIKNSKAEADILKEEVSKLKSEISEKGKCLIDMKMEHRSTENEARDQRDRIQVQVNSVHDMERTICRFEKIEEPRIVECEAELKALKLQISEGEKDLQVLDDAMNIEKQKLNDSDNEYKNIKLNMDLLDLKKQLQYTENAISELDITHAEKERDKYQEESLRLRSNYEKLSAENAGKLGEIKQLQNQIVTLNNQLQTDYKDVDETYQKEWIKLQTKSLVTDDIDTYSKALDSAIMKYHSLKMKDINRIIDELWKRTYSGTDVDTIKIKTDEMSNAKGKSYNYRVVMYKQDAELDMRGRCSAGQKVLAAIIIRLALSETFGVNCGVIALDEPTTNLDEENIESLARALSSIIEVRRHQKNFQLIVITHDEKFLNHMNASSYVDHFYKIKRDDRQKSQIEWVDINKVNN